MKTRHMHKPTWDDNCEMEASLLQIGNGTTTMDCANLTHPFRHGSPENRTINMNTVPDISSSESALREYEKLLQPARERFASSAGIRGMINPEIEAQTMTAFLLHFSALSIPVTEPVEGWILRAGESCSALGLGKIASALYKHSKAEAGHHQYHIDDFNALISFWNARWSPPATPTAILAHGLTRGGERYCRLHEDNIAGSTPYCQFAIEYEIELLPVQYGSKFVGNCVCLLGQEILDCMSFVTSHVEFDVGHTKFNSHFLGNLILEDPSRLASLAAAGADALDAFSDHLAECWQLAGQFRRAL